jgi:hypothetical protein
MEVRPMDANPDDPNDPNVDTNDFAVDMAMTPLYQAQPLDLKTWLETPGNMGDTTQVLISKNGAAIDAWSGSLQNAGVYLEAFYDIYPNLVTG